MAGATGLEPATSSVTGQLFSKENKGRFNFQRDNSLHKTTRFDFAHTKVETQNRAHRRQRTGPLFEPGGVLMILRALPNAIGLGRAFVAFLDQCTCGSAP